MGFADCTLKDKFCIELKPKDGTNMIYWAIFALGDTDIKHVIGLIENITDWKFTGSIKPLPFNAEDYRKCYKLYDKGYQLK